MACEAKKHVIDPAIHLVDSAWDLISGGAKKLYNGIKNNATAIEEALGAASGIICLIPNPISCGLALSVATLGDLALEAMSAKSAKSFAEQAAVTLGMAYVGGTIGYAFKEAEAARATAKQAKLLGRVFEGISTGLGGVLTAKMGSC